MKITCLSVFILLTGLNAVARSAEDPVTTAAPFGLVIKATPSSLFDRYATILPLGIEADFGERLGLGVNWALPLSPHKLLGKSGTRMTAARYRKLDVYLRYYFHPGAKRQSFVGVEGFYKEQKAHADYYSYSDWHREAFQSYNADVRKFVSGAGLYFGRRYRSANDHWFLEWYLGLGYKMVNNHVYADNKRSLGGKDMAMFPGEDVYDNSLRTLIYFPAALSFGYRF